MHLHFTQQKPPESIFVLQNLVHLPSSSVSQKNFVSTQKLLCKLHAQTILCIVVIHAGYSCIAAKRNYNISCVNWNLSIRQTQSSVNSDMFFQHCTMSRFRQLFRPALARKAGQRDPQTLVGRLVLVMALHASSRSKSGKKFSLSAMALRAQAASACDKHYSAPTRQAFSKVATACTPSSVSDVLPRYRLVSWNTCQSFETKSAESIFEVTQTNISALLGWDTSSAREALWIVQRVVDVQCNLQAVFESCHFFQANVNHQVLRLQIPFLFDFALQQVSKVSALQHISIRSCRSSAHVNSKSVANLMKSQGLIAMAFILLDCTVARGR